MKKMFFALILGLFALGAFGQVDKTAPKYDLTRPNPKTTAEINSMTRMQEGSEAWNTDTNTMWRYVNGSWIDTGTGIGTDDQGISLVGNTLTLEDGGSIDLSGYLDNKNVTSASLVGTVLTLTLTDASTVTLDISAIDTQLSDIEVETAYNNRVSVASQAEAEAGTSTNVRRFTPELIKQAIDALAPTGGTTYTAGNGLNLNTNELSVDSTRVTLVSTVSPILGPVEFAVGTNTALDELPAPASGVTRISFAIDGGGGTVSGGGVTDHGLLTGLGDDDHSQYHNDARAVSWLSSLYPNLDTDSTNDFSGDYSDLTGKSIATSDIQDNAITTLKIANSAVQSADILDGTIGSADIADSAVNGNKILDGTITESKMNSSFYETGTFTPTIFADTSDDYSSNTPIGEYVRVGDQVTVYIEFLSLNGTGSGFLRIGNLPFLPSNEHALTIGNIYGLSQNFYSALATIQVGTGNVSFYYQSSSDGSINQGLTDITFTNGAIVISGTYIRQ